jgi:hypothetical protein
VRQVLSTSIRRLLGLVLLCTTVAFAAPGALAQPEPSPKISGTWTMTSEEGDIMGRGRTYSFGPTGFSILSQGLVTVGVIGGDHWDITLAAPHRGLLEERVYTGARRFPAAGDPWLDVSGHGLGCHENFGSFTVHDVEYGVHEYLRKLHFTFEHRCGEPSDPALRGEVDLVSEPPPAPFALELTVAERAAIDPASEEVEVKGSIKCSQPMTARVIVEAAQAGRQDDAVGEGTQRLRCSRSPTDWAVGVVSTSGVPFSSGPLEVKARSQVKDQWWSLYTGGAIFARDEESARAMVAAPRAPDTTEVGETEAAGAGQKAVAGETVVEAGGLTGFVARDPALYLLLWLASLVAVVLATAWVTLRVTRGGRV